MIGRLRRAAARATDALAERGLDAAGVDVDDQGVLVLRVDGGGDARGGVRALARAIVELEGADVASPPWLSLVGPAPAPWPSGAPCALVCVDDPGAEWEEPLAEIADEFGWAPIVLVSGRAELPAARWVGAGCVPGVLHEATEASAWSRAADTLREATGVQPRFAGLSTGADEPRAASAARAAGLDIVLGRRPGLACSRLAMGPQPTVPLEGLAPGDALAWARRDRRAIAVAHARRAVLTLR